VTLARATVTLRDGLQLVAPGGVYIPSEHTLVVADTHIGYTGELRARGVPVPLGDDKQLIERVSAMVSTCRAERLVIAGDIVHGKSAANSLESFIHHFSSLTLRLVVGNHDRGIQRVLERHKIEFAEHLAVGVHVVTHGDDVEATCALRADAQSRSGRVLVGHIHPALVLDDYQGARKTCPAFVSAKALLCLPALSPWAHGGDVRSKRVRAQLEALALDDPMGVAVVIGEKVMPIGDVFSRLL
jgi:putative SbcD/Mre11-related phosphoesterase